LTLKLGNMSVLIVRAAHIWPHLDSS
jgi:hypothetical protein